MSHKEVLTVKELRQNAWNNLYGALGFSAASGFAFIATAYLASGGAAKEAVVTGVMSGMFAPIGYDFAKDALDTSERAGALALHEARLAAEAPANGGQSLPSVVE